MIRYDAAMGSMVTATLRLLLLLAAVGVTPFARGAGLLDDEYLRVGGGFGTVVVNGTANGAIQAFAGVDSVRRGPWRAGFEVTAMDVSKSSADGLGVAGLLSWSAVEDVSLFARAGVDFGGDSGYLLGTGVGYFIERNMEVRVELVSRQKGNGLFFSLAWYPRLNPYAW